MMKIEQVLLAPEIRTFVDEGFRQHALETVGYDGGIQPFTFAAYEEQILIGVVDCKFFWKQLHIRWLFVTPGYRGQGVGRALMEKALHFAKENGCHFAFVETMQFQALGFYQKLGFELEFSRSGYANDGIFHYLKKNL